MFHPLRDRPDKLGCVFDVGRAKVEGVPDPVVVHERFEGASRLGRAAALVAAILEKGRPVIATFRGKKTLRLPPGAPGGPTGT
jgi:hypothetical protein